MDSKGREVIGAGDHSKLTPPTPISKIAYGSRTRMKRYEHLFCDATI